MIKQNEVIKNNPDYRDMINEIVDKIGIDGVKDVNSYGMEGGFSGFIYYHETHDFAMRYRSEIVRMLEIDSENFGQDIISMVSSFGIFRRQPMDIDDKRMLYRYIGGGECEAGILTNIMAWYAVEQICFMFDN